MKNLHSTLKSLAVVAGVLVCGALAHGQTRTFVSSAGSDSNPCTVSSPCRTFQRGHDAVTAGGEVVALNSAGYSTLSITKSVTITGAGVHAAVTAAGNADGITIAAPGATVILRELTVTGNGAGGNGVLILNAATVHIERCVVTSFSQKGIQYLTNNHLFLTDTVVRSNALEGLLVDAPGGGTARVNIDGSHFKQNGIHGIKFNNNTIEASITNSTMSGNGGNGFEIDSSGNARVNVAHSTAANNGSNGFLVGGAGVSELNIEYSVARGNSQGGMTVVGGDTIRVSNSVSTNNGTGFNNLNGTFATRGNNTVDGNGANLVGAFSALGVG